VNYLAKFLDNPQELLTLILGTAGGAFALWRWTVEQKWRRVLYAQNLLEKFLQKETTLKAFDILDIVDEDVEFKFQDESKRPIKLTNDFLIGALSTFTEKELNDEREIVVRKIMSVFFDDLSTFQNHIEAGLIKPRDIKPYLEYWFQELTAKGRVHDDIRLAFQIAKYLSYFGYGRVLTLARSMGYPFPQPTKT
jgi:hypothetical protein